MIARTRYRIIHVCLSAALCGASFGTAAAGPARERAPDGRAANKDQEPEDLDPEVAQHLQAASDAFAKRDYDAAVAEFEAAYLIQSDPSFLFNIGRVHEEAGNLKEALAHYERFVGEPGVSLENRTLANERIVLLKPLIETTQTAGSLADSSEPGESAVPSGESSSMQSGATVDRFEPKRSRWLIISGAALAGAGAAAGVLGAVFVGMSVRAADEADGADSPEEYDDFTSQARQDGITGIALFAGGGALLLGGAAALAIGLTRRAKNRSRRAAAWNVVPALGSAAVRVRF